MLPLLYGLRRRTLRRRLGLTERCQGHPVGLVLKAICWGGLVGAGLTSALGHAFQGASVVCSTFGSAFTAALLLDL